MARKRRKSATAKRKKKSRVLKRKTRRATVKRRKLRRRRPKTLGGTVTSAYRTVVDTIKGTDTLRNKMELPSTSETE